MDRSRAIPDAGAVEGRELVERVTALGGEGDEETSIAALEERYGHYSITMTWDPDDRIYVVTVPELPGCRTHGATPVEAAAKARQAIATWIEAALHWGEAIPPPATERHIGHAAGRQVGNAGAAAMGNG